MKDPNEHSETLSDRLKHVQLEQLPPNQPSFLTVVLLFAAALIVLFILAIFVLHLDRGKLFRRHQQHPTSQLILPPQPSGGLTFGYTKGWGIAR